MNKIRFSVMEKPFPHDMLAIYICCEQFGKSVEIDTSVHVFSDEWDDVAGRIKGNPNSKKLNVLIRKTLYELEAYELEYDGEFTLSKLERIWQGREATHDFYKMMEHHIGIRDIRKSTAEIHLRVLKQLKLYKPSCNVSELTEEYVRGFMAHQKQSGYGHNTIRTHLNVLRCYYHVARKLFGGKVPAGTFEFWHVKKSEKMHLTLKALEDEDIRLIENHVVQGCVRERDRLELERFLFMSYTGTRISDFRSLTGKNFTYENGRLWLTYTSVKTGTDVRIPLSTIFDGRAEQLVSKHRDHLPAFFDVGRWYNASLQRAAKKAGITKRITAHIARHTCASRLVSKGVPITTIQKIIGHRSLRMTMEYANTSETALVRQLS